MWATFGHTAHAPLKPSPSVTSTRPQVSLTYRRAAAEGWLIKSSIERSSKCQDSGLAHGCHHRSSEAISAEFTGHLQSISWEFSPDPAHPESHWVLALCAASSDWSLSCNPNSLQTVLVFSPGWEPEPHGQLLGGLGLGEGDSNQRDFQKCLK